MRNIILSILFLFTLNLMAEPMVEQTDSIIISKDPVFTLESENYHFGTIDTLRQNLEYDFNFCNDGLETLVIHRILTPPGVTILERELIDRYNYDEGGIIRFVIDPKEIKGTFKKSIYIYSNTPTRKLTLSGTVLRPRH